MHVTHPSHDRKLVAPFTHLKRVSETICAWDPLMTTPTVALLSATSLCQVEPGDQHHYVIPCILWGGYG